MRKFLSSFPRRRESSNTTSTRGGQGQTDDSLGEDHKINWIPACAGMTQRGFSLVSALFLLVVLSFLGVAMVSFSTAQHQSSAMDVMGSRAYQAARAGIEWATYQVVSSVSNAAGPTNCATNFAADSLGGTLAPFNVTVNCVATSHVEGASNFWIYDVSAVAQTGGVAGGSNFVERVMNVKLGK